MAKPRPEKDPEPAQPGTRRVLPMELHVGDRLADESGEWEVIAHPYVSGGGEFTCVEGPKGFETWEEAEEAGRFLERGESWTRPAR